MDSKGVRDILEKRAKLQTEREFTETRLNALEQQQHATLRTEAEHRLQEVLQAASELFREGGTQTKRVAVFCQQLEEAIALAFSTRTKQNALRDEARFLAQFFDFPMPTIEGAPTPNEKSVSGIQRQIEAGEQTLRQQTEWAQKTAQLKEERARQQSKEQLTGATYSGGQTESDAETVARPLPPLPAVDVVNPLQPPSSFMARLLRKE